MRPIQMRFATLFLLRESNPAQTAAALRITTPKEKARKWPKLGSSDELYANP